MYIFFSVLLIGALIILWLFYPLLKHHFYLRHCIKQTSISTASGKGLNRWASLLGTKRNRWESDKKLRKRLVDLIMLPPKLT